MEPSARNVPPRPDPIRDAPRQDRDAAEAKTAGSAAAEKSLRAQLLATEHWSVLASRSTTQSEILTRIAIFLTLVSAGLVTLGILGQATAFGETFSWAAAGVLAFLVLVGTLTEVRVINAMAEDLAYVLAMNRLRGGYADLDPGIERYFLASVNDDEEGVDRTYYFYGRRGVTQVIGSSGMFIISVNSVLTALLVGFLTLLAGTSPAVALAVGVAAFAAALLVSMRLSYRMYGHLLARILPLRRTGS